MAMGGCVPLSFPTALQKPMTSRRQRRYFIKSILATCRDLNGGLMQPRVCLLSIVSSKICHHVPDMFQHSNTKEWLVWPDKTHTQSYWAQHLPTFLKHQPPPSPPPRAHWHTQADTLYNKHTLGLSLWVYPLLCRGVSNIQIYIDGCNLSHPSPSIKSSSADIPMVQQLQWGHKLCDFQRRNLKEKGTCASFLVLCTTSMCTLFNIISPVSGG